MDEIMNCLTYLPNCGPKQVVTLTYAVDDISKVIVYKTADCAYSAGEIEYSYSVDNVCWSCYFDYDTALANTVAMGQDFYIKIKVAGQVAGVSVNGTATNDYGTTLAECFEFTYASLDGTNTNLYNPYSNMTSAVALQQQLNESVASVVGIPIYYFKLSPNTGSKDITFKEYTLMDVESVKQIKLIVGDGTMPSSRPEFTDFGLDWEADWETEISKGMFATAFGNTAQPMEGDLVYIPMMKRMWMVNSAYEEKNGSLMWNATTFKVMLVKYQEKGSVNLGDTEFMVNSFIKNKYDDLFGEDDSNTFDSGMAALDAPTYSPSNLYPVYESDATRKFMTCDLINVVRDENLYYRGTMIADSKYTFSYPDNTPKIIYQQQYCGTDGTLSFIFHPTIVSEREFTADVISIGKMKVQLTQYKTDITLKVNKVPKAELKLTPNSTYFVVLQWSKQLNLVSFNAYRYVFNTDMPRYRLTSAQYWFDIDNPVATYSGGYDQELVITEKKSVEMHGFYGWITNIKLFDVYNDNISEVLQMFPTHQHLMINDVARKLVGGLGADVR